MPQVLYPWPFAGYSNEGGLGDTPQWWDEICFVGKVDLAQPGATELGAYFGFPQGKIAREACPSVVLLPRGSVLSARRASEVRHVGVSEEYRSFVWAQVRTRSLTPLSHPAPSPRSLIPLPHPPPSPPSLTPLPHPQVRPRPSETQHTQAHVYTCTRTPVGTT